MLLFSILNTVFLVSLWTQAKIRYVCKDGISSVVEVGWLLINFCNS